MDVAGCRKFFCGLFSMFLFDILQVPCRCNRFVCEFIASICIMCKKCMLWLCPQERGRVSNKIFSYQIME